MRNIVGQTPRGDDFFPRPTVVDRIYRALANDAHLYLAAPRRVGKTAIMRHLEDKPQPQYAFKYLITESVDNATTYFTVLVEAVHTLKKLPRRTLEALGAFLQGIREIEVAGVGIRWEAGEATGPFAAFKKLVQTFDTNGMKVVVMVDEFPQTVKNILQRHGQDAAEHFLQLNREIRHEAHANIRFMLTGSIGLPTMAEQLNATQHINDLRTIEIPPLGRDEARELTTSLLAHEHVAYEASAIEHLLDKIAWFIPFHIQLTAQELIDGYLDTQEPVDRAAVDKAFARIGETRNDIYFAHYYSRLEKIFTKNELAFALALLKTLTQQDEIVVQEIHDLARQHAVEHAALVLRTLVFDGYISASETNAATWYRFTSPVLRLWWKQYVQ